MLVSNRSPRASRGKVIALLAAVLAIAGAASARDLPPIDRLGDAAPARADAVSRAAQAGKDEAIRPHSRLQVPAFLWGHGGGPAAAGIAAVAAGAPRDAVAAARAYLQGLDSIYALRPGQLDTLPPATTQDFANGAALVKFRNRIDGVDVFREEAAVLLSPERKLVAIGGFLTGGAATGAFDRSAAEAAAVALADWSFDANIAPALRVIGARDGYEYLDLPPGRASSADGSRLDAPLRVRPVYFRLPDQLVPAYYVEVQVHDGAQSGAMDYYAYVIAATDLSVLYRHSQTADAAFTYRVFAEAGGNNLPYPAPTGRGAFPSPTGVSDGFQPPFVAPNLVTLQNLPFSRNDPWLAPGATQTSGNNVNAFANLVMPDGFGPVDPAECNVGVAPTGGDFHACTTAANTFDYTYDTALAPKANKTQVMASTTNLFYLNNWLHDWFYDAGFDEASGNAQAGNYGRGGVEGDPIIAEAQDASGTNNANMSTPADGGSPRMRMYRYEYRFPMIKVLAPAAIAGVKPAGLALFGAQAFDVTANVVYAVPANGCSPLTNAAAVAGKVAMIDLYAAAPCSFATKAKNAQDAGAAAVLLVNDLAPSVGWIFDTDATITIPTSVIGSTDANAIKGQPDNTVSVRVARANRVDRDGTLDNAIVAHEWGHYISNRLVANANGLTTNQAKGLGEGWSDFHALLLLVKGTDSALPNNAGFNGTYATGGYTNGGPDFAPDLLNTSFFYGVRRYPYSRDLAKNPLTFKHIEDGVALPAAPARQTGSGGGINSQVHNTGEVWASMLWQCYSNLLDDTARLSFAQAQDRMKNYLVAGYKMTPANPTFIEARDALLAVIGVQSGEDYLLCLQGFASRGAGIGAVAPDRYSTNNAGVVESFSATTAVLEFESMALSDRPLYCDADGILDNGETGLLTITLRNAGGSPLSTTAGTVAAGNPHVQFPSGAAFVFPPSAPGQTVSAAVPVTLVGAVGREATDITVNFDDPLLPAAPVPVTESFLVNSNQVPAQSATDDVESPHTVWHPTYFGARPTNWQRVQFSPTDHRWASSDPSAITDEWLLSPPLQVAATGSFSFTFKHRHNFEFDAGGDYDGGLLAISEDNGASFYPVPAAALTPSYNGTLFDGPGADNPRKGLAAYVRTNGGYPAQSTVTVNLGTAYQGKTVLIGFLSSTDSFNVAGTFTGWEIDDIAFSNLTNTPFDLTAADAGACVNVTPLAGTPQSALVGTPFAASLQALVTSALGAPLPGLPVTFTVPAGGASATLGGPAAVITDASGVATAPTLTANASQGTYNATATAGKQSTTFALTNNAPAAPAPALVQVVSRKTHGATPFDLVLAATPLNPTTEPRTAKPAGTHTLVFQFDAALAGGVATVTAGTGVAGAPTFSGNEMVVPVTGVANAQYLTVGASNVASIAGGTGGSGSVRVGFLLGDVNGTRSVTLADILSMNAVLSQTLMPSNFLRDINLSGTLSLADLLLINSSLTTALPGP